MGAPQSLEECAEKLQAARQGLQEAKDALEAGDVEGAGEIITRTIGTIG